MEAVTRKRRISAVDLRARVPAIARAVALATPDDLVLIAGKGHERTQEIAGVKHAFYDPDEARIALARRKEAATC